MGVEGLLSHQIMDRFAWVSSTSLVKGESEILQKHNVRIYDGDNRVSQVTITSSCWRSQNGRQQR